MHFTMQEQHSRSHKNPSWLCRLEAQTVGGFQLSISENGQRHQTEVDTTAAVSGHGDTC